MNILVTGSCGFIGSHLIPLLKKKHHVRSYDYVDNKDILDIKTLTRNIRWADAVYHLAALTDVQDSFEHQEEYYMVNVDGTFNVVNACKAGNKKLIYTSTAASYSPTSSPYAHSKKLAEKAILYAYPQATIFRLFNVYGDGMNKTTMLSRFQRENPIVIYGTGNQTRDFIHIDDITQILVSALSKKWNGFIGDVGTGKEISVLSVAKLFKKPIIHASKRSEVYHSKADIRALRKLYKKPFRKLQDFLCVK